MKTVRAWCVKSRMGNLITESVSVDITTSINKVISMFDLDFPEYRKDGYKEVKVEIREVEDEQTS